MGAVAPPGPARPARIPAAVTVVTHLGCIVNVVAHLGWGQLVLVVEIYFLLLYQYVPNIWYFDV